MSLSMASGACASTSEASANTSPPSQEHEIFLGEEEISDVSLATFYVFDNENAEPPPLFQKLRLAAGCGAGCGCSFGCARDSDADCMPFHTRVVCSRLEARIQGRFGRFA
jgi:hypothetical protein